jgi:predicted hydrocarbon binding protein
MTKANSIPLGLFSKFLENLSDEIGNETFLAVMSKAGLSDWVDTRRHPIAEGLQVDHSYAELQSALRTYYGRGARGILLRIGEKLWQSLLDDASFGTKTRTVLVCGIPRSLRLKPALELLVHILGAKPGEVTIHTLDLDLLLVDRASPTSRNQSAASPICFITLGLIRECLYWADGREHDVEEIACKAAGAPQCEFKITIGG